MVRGLEHDSKMLLTGFTGLLQRTRYLCQGKKRYSRRFVRLFRQDNVLNDCFSFLIDTNTKIEAK